jgi:two-component system, sensor histidine kinase
LSERGIRDRGEPAAADGAVVGTAAFAVPDSFYRYLVEAAPDAMIVVDEQGLIAITNAEAERVFGYSRGEMLGQPIEFLLPARFRDRHSAHRGSYTAAPRLRTMGSGMELAGLRADGQEFPVEISLSPIQSGSRVFVASMIRDVTERHTIERALTIARQDAERAQKANSAFLAAASHDLRQPVQALRLLAGALRRTVKEPLAQEMIASQIESLEGMTNLLNSLLDVSRLDAGVFEPNIEEFPVCRVLDQFGGEWARQARHKLIDFSVHSCDGWVRSDPDLLAEILQNLVSNAIRYTEAGSVRLACRATDTELAIGVTDTGIGIEADQLENIFGEFVQVRNPERKREGFGLGLAITRRLADLLGHRITVTSVPGEGSVFTLHVARAPEASSTGPEERRDAVPAHAPSALIVIVEDDEQVAAAWRLLLKAEGYEVALAASAREALDLVAGGTVAPRLIISDYHLAEGSNGMDAVMGMRDEIGACVPAFIVTGDTSKIDVDSLANSRMMNKPVEPEQLLSLASAALATGSA